MRKVEQCLDEMNIIEKKLRLHIIRRDEMRGVWSVKCAVSSVTFGTQSVAKR
jgi:hypothetical protein